VDAEAGATTWRRPESDLGLHLGGELLAESEPEPGAALAPARREERLENPIANVGRDAGALPPRNDKP
jgi:hypothetical protein